MVVVVQIVLSLFLSSVSSSSPFLSAPLFLYHLRADGIDDSDD